MPDGSASHSAYSLQCGSQSAYSQVCSVTLSLQSTVWFPFSLQSAVWLTALAPILPVSILLVSPAAVEQLDVGADVKAV